MSISRLKYPTFWNMSAGNADGYAQLNEDDSPFTSVDTTSKQGYTIYKFMESGLYQVRFNLGGFVEALIVGGGAGGATQAYSWAGAGGGGVVYQGVGVSAGFQEIVIGSGGRGSSSGSGLNGQSTEAFGFTAMGGGAGGYGGFVGLPGGSGGGGGGADGSTPGGHGYVDPITGLRQGYSGGYGSGTTGQSNNGSGGGGGAGAAGGDNSGTNGGAGGAGLNLKSLFLATNDWYIAGGSAGMGANGTLSPNGAGSSNGAIGGGGHRTEDGGDGAVFIITKNA